MSSIDQVYGVYGVRGHVRAFKAATCRRTPKFIAGIIAGTFVTSALFSAFAQEKSDEELVKELSNPVASLISVPFQSNFEFKLGPNNDGFRYTLNFQPLIPISLNKDWNVIVRTIVPIIDQSDVTAPNTSQGGLSDITQSFFFSPKKPVAGMIVGAGPVFLYPSATDDLLGSEKWEAGPTIVLLKQTGPWTVGLLFNHIWSFAGDDHRNYVSSTFLQPFVAYATKTKTTFTLNTESSYDWHNDQWTVPINLLVSQLIKIGKQPVQLGLGAKIYAEGPSGARMGDSLRCHSSFPDRRETCVTAASFLQQIIQIHRREPSQLRKSMKIRSYFFVCFVCFC